MQTFLPYSDFKLSAQSLDNLRLRKQHVEAFQIIKIVETGSKAWKNHPVVRMWENHIPALKVYTNTIKDEILFRGFRSVKIDYYPVDVESVVYPEWLGRRCLHISHQSNLVRKDPTYYTFSGTKPELVGYYWPCKCKSSRCQKVSETWELLFGF